MAINNNSTINSTAESAAYTYDLQQRLVTSSQTTNGVSAQRRFAHDRWGNRAGMWDATSGGNQIQSITLQQSGGAPTNQIQSVTAGSTVNYAYDAAGNVTNDGAHTYQYDAENRIKSVDSAATGSYRYDYQNRRIKRSTSSVAIHYIWDGNQVLAEHNMNTGAQIVDYVYAGSKLIAEGPGSQLGGNASTTFLVRDRLSTRLLVGTTGGVLGRQATLSFGEELGESGTQEKHHFTTYESDPEAGTDYAVNRQFVQGIGRFARPDPYQGSYDGGNRQSFNRYSYCGNDPMNKTDAPGLGWEYVCVNYFDPNGEGSSGTIVTDCGWICTGSDCQSGPGPATAQQCNQKVDQYGADVAARLLAMQGALYSSLRTFDLLGDLRLFTNYFNCFMGATKCDPKVTLRTFENLGWKVKNDLSRNNFSTTYIWATDQWKKAGDLEDKANSDIAWINTNCKGKLDPAHAKQLDDAYNSLRAGDEAFNHFFKGFNDAGGQIVGGEV